METLPRARQHYSASPRGATVEQRFWLKVSGASYQECWIWTASLKPNGYGQFRPSRRENVYAHRWAYEWLIAEIPAGLHLDHLCRNRRCVNPWHLEPVTTLVNNHRGETNAAKTHCPQGHEYTEENTARTGGRRYCITCRTARNRARTLRRGA